MNGMDLSIRELGENIKKLQNFKGKVLFQESMAFHTTMKTGGRAELFVMPEDISSCSTLLKMCIENNIRVFVIGGGSNVVACDEDMNFVILSTEKLDFINLTSSGTLKIGAGTKISELMLYCEENTITGLEKFSGLPGTVGGAAFMNARCYEEDFGTFIKSVSYIDFNSCSEVKTYFKKDGDWDYKVSPFQKKNAVIVQVELNGFVHLEKSESAVKTVSEQNDFYLKDRIAKGHFKAPSAGSVFRNNHDFGKPSGVLIDEAGLKGTSCGDAQIASWHGNFIINNGNAKSSEIESLVKLAQNTVKEKTGFNLVPEIIFLKN